MFGENPENVYFYVTIYNEPYPQPAEPENLDVTGLLKGIYRYLGGEGERTNVAQILASGVSMPEALRAADMLTERWDVAADVWSVTSWNELHRDGVEVAKQTLRHPELPAPVPYVTEALGKTAGPAVAVSDWMRAVPSRSGPGCPTPTSPSAPTGSGSPTPAWRVRRCFNTDAESVVVVLPEALARDGEIDLSVAVAAAREYRIDDVGSTGTALRSRSRVSDDFRLERGIAGAHLALSAKEWRSF